MCKKYRNPIDKQELFVYNFSNIIYGGIEMKKLLSVFFAIIMVCSLCIIPASAASPKLNKKVASLPIGYSLTLKVSNADDVKWSSNDKSIAKVKSAKGNTAKIVGVSSGSTYIYADVNGKQLKCKVTVKKSFITADKDEVTVAKGDKVTLTFNVSGSKKIVYSNGGPEKCTITSAKWSGNKLKLTVKGKDNGSALIKVYTKGYSKTTMETVTVKVSGKSSGKATISDKPASTTESNLSVQDQVLELVNAERKDAGKSAVKLDSTLNQVAQLRANELLKNLSHTRPDGTVCFTAFDEMGAKYGSCSENIAAGQMTPEEVMSSWMSSSGHKANILDSNAEKMGVALVTVPSGYGYYWVQVFTD